MCSTKIFVLSGELFRMNTCDCVSIFLFRYFLLFFEVQQHLQQYHTPNSSLSIVLLLSHLHYKEKICSFLEINVVASVFVSNLIFRLDIFSVTKIRLCVVVQMERWKKTERISCVVYMVYSPQTRFICSGLNRDAPIYTQNQIQRHAEVIFADFNVCVCYIWHVGKRNFF